MLPLMLALVAKPVGWTEESESGIAKVTSLKSNKCTRGPGHENLCKHLEKLMGSGMNWKTVEDEKSR